MNSCPPLNSIRFFLEVARCGTLTGAAGALGRTHGAVGKQIRALERWLKVDLFAREHGRLILTDQGRSYMESAAQAFSILERANSSLRPPRSQNTIRIKCTPAFAKRWLISRMAVFIRDNPAIDIHLTANDAHGVIESNDYDILIIDHPPETGLLNVEPFMSGCILPVCCPRERAGYSSRSLPLIATSDQIANWPLWFEMARDEAPPVAAGMIRIDDLDAALSAARMGVGLVVARGHLVVDDIASGDLVAASKTAIQFDTSYWLIRPPSSRRWREEEAFARFLRQEAQITSERLKKHLSLHVNLRYVGRLPVSGAINGSAR